MKRLLRNSLAILCVVAFFPVMASAVETYKFERMFPVLQQPWYFSTPSGLAIDSKGFIYVADMNAHCIQKFTSDGFFVTQWGTRGNDDGNFYQPTKIAIDKDDNVYVTDNLNNRVQKFNSDGKFVTKWGEKGKEDGQFDRPKGIAIDKNGIVYVADANNYRIQKFDLNGKFIDKWGGKQGSGDGEFQDPYAIAIDSIGNVYVADSDNNCIQKFDTDGNIFKWGTQGKDKGQFQNPSGIFIDKLDNVYVTDSKNHRIQIFDINGNFIKIVWGSTTDLSQYQDVIDQNSDLLPLLSMMIGTFQPGLHVDKLQYDDVIDFLLKDAKEGTFNRPTDIVMDQKGDIYVADSSNQRIQKFGSDEKLISSWGSVSNREGMFKGNIGVAINNNFLYVCDSKNHRIQKFTKDGKFAGQWGKQGSGNGEFQFPTGIAANNEFVYVVDTFNHRIQKFTHKGDYVTQWGGRGEENRKFQLPLGIALDKDGNIYVTDSLNYRIQKFTPDGAFMRKWESAKIFGYPIDEMLVGLAGIAVDNSGNIYATNIAQNRFQKFDSNGNLLYYWGGDKTQFQVPFGIATDNNFVFVTDTVNSRIRQFNSDGVFVQDIGKLGPDVGQFRYPIGLAIDTEKIYVADFANNRIQIFKKGLDTDKKMKAIIIAGGGSYDGNSIWNETQMNANFAYRALKYQGFSNDAIYYLSSNTSLDLDNDGVPEVKADSTNADLQKAITEWAKDADSLVIYFVDHGGDGVLRTGATEFLQATQLNDWLNTAQQSIPGTVTFVYDACYSGSFLLPLKPPDNKKRIVISSASEKEAAWFMTDGSVSFSNYFWTHIFNGVTVGDAFNLSRNAIGYLPDLKNTRIQNPQIDDNGDGISDDKDGLLARITPIGNGTVNSANVPIIGSVSQEQTIDSVQTTSADITAKDIVSPDNNNIVHVWAVIRPPDYRQGSGNPVTDLPSVELQPIGDGVYKATYTEFKVPGTYQILVYARDDKANTSVPKQTAVIVQSPLRHKAIIVAGAVQTDKWWNVVEDSIRVAYNALKFQGYSDDNGNNDIALMSPVSIGGGVMPTLPTSDNLKNAISRLTGDNTQDVVIYLIGNSENGIFKINPAENLSPTELNEWLEELQNRITGKVVIVYDACQAENFLHVLAPFSSGKRILIGSTSQGEAAYFLTEGRVSFSQFFWSRILSGVSVKDAFDAGRYAFDIGRDVSRPVFCKPQTPYLDDDGDGRWNSKNDGDIAENFRIGAGKMPGEEPLIVSGATLILTEDNPPLLKAKVISSGIIDSVWAIIDTCDLAASPDIPITELRPETKLIYNPDSGMYEGTVDKLWISSKCKITIYAKNKDGKISLPAVPSPSVMSAVRIGSPPPNASGIDFTVTFSENVSGIDISDFALVKSGTAGGTIASVSASSGKSVTVTVKNITGDGILGLNLVDNDSIVNDSGIALGGAGLNNGNFVGETCEVNIPTPIPPIQPGTAVFITSVSDVTAISAKAFGTTSGEGITERGFFWWNDEQYWGPRASGLLPASGSGTGDFSLSMMNLPVSTELYVSAYIKIGNQIITAGPGNFIRITTRGPAPPTVITKPDFTVNGNKILAKGEITDVGAFPVTIYGFVYAKHPSPTVWDMALPFTWDTNLPISQGKSFEGTIRNLSDGNYFFRAYAHNQNPYTGGNQNTVYGEEFGFTIGSVRGDLNGNGKLDLTDVILVLQVLSGSDTKIRSDYAGSETDVNGDIRMGLEEAIYILQKITELR